ncbi:hypothetical protein L1887_14514 [Cichorium endivia]|nr:hypothetical protein L1887_14514 [Cichorium endivia]
MFANLKDILGILRYLEVVSVLPQLRVLQNTEIVEPFTAYYVFALGVAMFLSYAHWDLQGKIREIPAQ